MPSDTGLWVVIVSSAFLTTLLIVPVVIRVANYLDVTYIGRDKWVDVPGEFRQKSHDYPVPIIGGAAVCVSCMVTALIAVSWPGAREHSVDVGKMLAVLIGGGVIALVGLLDDVKKLSYVTRFVAQIASISAVLLLTTDTTLIRIPGLGLVDAGVLYVPFGVIWVVAITNAVNLIDGLDGLASGLTVIAAVFLMLVGLDAIPSAGILAVAILVSCAAFLKFNLRPAKAFLGSCGTLFIGFVLGTLTMWGDPQTGENNVLAYSIPILSVPLVDMGVVFTARLRHGLNPFVADSWHIHDRVLRVGVNHRVAAVMIWSVAVLGGGAAVIGSKSEHLFWASMVALVATYAVLYFVVIKVGNRHSDSISAVGHVLSTDD